VSIDLPFEAMDSMRASSLETPLLSTMQNALFKLRQLLCDEVQLSSTKHRLRDHRVSEVVDAQSAHTKFQTSRRGCTTHHLCGDELRYIGTNPATRVLHPVHFAQSSACIGHNVLKCPAWLTRQSSGHIVCLRGDAAAAE
jgi:hypothetical protein